MSKEPKNELEAVLFKAMAGELTMDDFLRQLMISDICIPSSEEVTDEFGRGLSPIFYDRNGVKMVAVFTHIDRIDQRHRDLAQYCLRTKATWFIGAMPPTNGIVLFAGPGRGCELLPHALADLRKPIN